MKNDLLTIGGLTVHGYGLMIAIGIIAAYVVAEKRAVRKGLDPDSVFSLVIWALVSGFLGSKILFILTILPEVISNPSILKDVWSGWVVYGSIIGGAIGIALMCRVKKLDFWQYIDLTAPSMALAQGFGRVGCLLAGCCYGIRTSLPIAITFHNSDFAPNNVPLMPTQIMSSILDFINAGVLLWLDSRKKAEGETLGWYLVFYSVGRFFLEYLRGDLERGSVGIFSTSQFIAIGTLAVGVCVLAVRRFGIMKKKDGVVG
jgi:phosphatidylglycerol:prolipoprotein diacylglycerol transferase